MGREYRRDSTSSALLCNKAGGRDDMQYEVCQHKTTLVRVLNKHVQYTCCACTDTKDPSDKMTADACVIIHPHCWTGDCISLVIQDTVLRKSINLLGKFLVFRTEN